MKFSARPLLALTLLVLVGSCVSGDGSTGLGDSTSPAGVFVQPAIIFSAADADALPINRIRAVAARVPSNVQLADTTFVVSPDSASWSIGVNVVLPESPIEVRVFIYLVNEAQDGTQAVQFSGQTDVLTLTRGAEATSADLDIVRGPLANTFVTEVAITTADTLLVRGRNLALTSTFVSTSASPPTVFWTSLDTSVVVISDSVATGVTSGVAMVVASSGPAADTITLTVIEPPVDSVEVSPDSVAVVQGQSTTFTAVLRADDGAVLTGRTLAWSVADPAVATIDALTGVVTSVAVGQTTVTATSEGVTDDAVIVVIPVPVGEVVVTPSNADVLVGQTLAFTAQTLDSIGGVLTGRAITWSTADATVATIDPSTGVATAIATGSTTITATSEGVSDVAVISVTQVPVDSVLASPDSTEVRVGGQTTFAAQTFDSIGGSLTGRVVTWASSDAGVATVDGAGEVTGIAPGVTTITATSEGVSDAALLTVSLVPVDGVAVSPDSSEILIGGQTTFTAQTLDSIGGVLTGRPVAWSSGDAGIATIDPQTGVLTGVSMGSTTVTATSEGVSDGAIIVVSLVPVDSISVAPTTATIDVAATASFSAELFDSIGGALTGRPVTWSIGDPGIATVDQAGLVTGVTPGTTTVTATSEGVAANATVTVLVPPPANLNRWENTQGGVWSDAASWSKGVLPVAGDSVVIDLDGTYEVLLDQDAQVTSLELGSAAGQPLLTQSANTMTISGFMDIGTNGMYDLQGGTLGGNGEFTVGGDFEWGGGTFSGLGTLTVLASGNSLWTLGAKTIEFRAIQNAGSIEWDGGDITFVDGASVTNDGSFDWTGDTATNLLGGTEGSFTNSSDFIVAGVGPIAIDIGFANDGLVGVQNGALTLQEPGTHSGQFAISSGAILNSNESPNVFDGVVNGAGEMIFSSDGPGNAVNGEYALGGINAIGALVEFSSTATLTATLDSIVRAASGTLTFNVPGTVTAGTWLLSGGAIDGSSNFVVADSLDWSGGQFSPGGGDLTIAAGASAHLRDAQQNKTLSGRDLSNLGTVFWDEGDLTLVGATVTNEPTGIFTATNTLSLLNGGGTTLLDNQGSLFVDGDLTSASVFENSGTFDVRNGTASFGNDVTLLDQGLVQGTGTFDVSGANVLGFDGTVAPGDSPGVLSLTGDYAPGGGGLLAIELGGSAVGLEYDQWAVSGAATLDGALVVDTINGFGPTVGDRFAIMTFASRTGSFSSVTLPSLGAVTVDTVWAEAGTTDTLFIEVSAAGPPPFTVVGFDAARGGDFSIAAGGFMEDARASLAAAFPGVVPTGVNSLTAGALAGADILVLATPFDGFGPVSPLSGGEQAELLAFVAAGGCAVLLADNTDFASANASFLDPFGMVVTGLSFGTATATSVSPESGPITNGILGQVDAFTQSFPGSISDLGPNGYVLATNPIGVAAAVIPSNALGLGSGPVIIHADAGALQDAADGGSFGPGDNENLWGNSLAACFELVPPPGPTGTQTVWTGSSGGFWAQGASWSMGGPGQLRNGFIWGGAQVQPTVIASQFVQNLTAETGATVTITTGSLNVSGDLAIDGSIEGTGTVTKVGAGTTIYGPISNLRTTDSITAIGDLTISGNLDASGPGSGANVLNLNGFNAIVGGDLTVGPTGFGGVRFTGGDTLRVAGDARFAGGNSTDRYSAGVMIFRGDLLEDGGSIEEYNPTGTHETVFNSNSNQFVTIQDPTTATLQNVTIDKLDSGLGLNSDARVDGTFFMPNGSVDLNGNTLTLAGAIDVGDDAGISGDGTIDMSLGTVTAFEGDLAPGSLAGVMDVLTPSAGLTQAPESGFFLEILGTTPGTEYDQLRFIGDIALGGDLRVDTLFGFVPAVGDRFAIMTFSSRGATTFANVTLPTIPGLQIDTVWAEAGTTDTLFVEVSAVPLASLSRWIEPAGGLWSVGANWSKGIPPEVGDSVVIDLAGSYTVTLDQDATIDFLEMGNGANTVDLDQIGNTLQVGLFGVAPGSTHSLLGGTLSMTAGAIGGDMQWSGGTLTATDTLAVLLGGVLDLQTSSTFGGGVIDNNGTFSWTAGDLTFQNGGTIRNGNTMTTAAGGLFQPFGGGVFQNDGTFSRLGTGVTTIQVDATNDGIMDVQSGTLFLQGTGDVIHSGTFTGVAGTTVGFVGSGDHQLDAAVSGFDRVNVGNDNVIFNAPVTTDWLSISQFANATINAGLIGVDSILVQRGLILNGGGPFTIPYIRMDGASVTGIQGPEDLTVTDSLIWGGGRMDGPGARSIASTALVRIISGTGSAFMVGGTLTNNGTVFHEANSLAMENGAVFINAAGATYDIQNDRPIIAGINGAAPTFTNLGTFTKSTGDGVSAIDVPFEVFDTLDVQAGALDFNSTFTHAPGAVLRGIGTIDLDDATVAQFAGDVNPGDSPGILGVTATTLNQDALSSFNVELEGTTAGSGYDQLNFSDEVSLSGSLLVDTLNGFVPTAGDRFAVMTYVDRGATTFAGVGFPSVDGLQFDTVWAEAGTVDTLFIEATSTAPPNLNVWTAGSGLWSAGSNWSRGSPPVAGDSVRIEEPGSYAITIDQDATVDYLIVDNPLVNATIDHSANTMTVDSLLFVGAGSNYSLTGGTLAGAHTGLLDGNFIWNGGTYEGPDPLSATTTLNSTSNQFGGVAKSLTNRRTISLASGIVWTAGDIGIGNFGQIQIQPTGLVEIAGNVSVNDLGGGEGLLIEGTLDLLTGTLDVNSDFTLDEFGFVQGDGTLDLAGANVGGWLGDMSPGTSPGQLDIITPAAGLTLDPISITYIDIEGDVPETGYDVIDFAGDVTLSGDLVVDTLGGVFSPTDGDAFPVITVAGARTGVFGSLTTPHLVGVELDTVWISGAGVDTLYLVANGFPLIYTSVAGDGDILIQNAAGDSIEALAATTDDEYEPNWSPDGTRIVYTVDDGFNQRLFTMNADGSSQAEINAGLSDDNFEADWSPDGSQFVFTNRVFADEEVWVMNDDGSGATSLTGTGGDNQPDWHPNGDTIVFVSNRDGAGEEIYYMDPDGSNPVRITNNADSDYAPRFSPDGLRVAWISTRDEPTGEIYVMDVDGTNVTRLTFNTAVDDTPAWSPDGALIYFVSDRDEANGEIYVMGDDGSAQARLTFNTSVEGNPVVRY